MDAHNPLIPVYYMASVLEAHQEMYLSDCVPFHLQVLDADGIRAASTWIAPPTSTDTVRIRKSSIALLAGAVDEQTQWIVTSINDLPKLDVFPLIPNALGFDQQIVQRLRNLVTFVETPPIAQLLSDAFTLRELFHHFWTCPASQAHHHAFRGGLAVHSIEMAERVADTPRLSATDRDLGIAYALLHDIGKLWCYGTDDRERMQHLGHELIGMTRLNDALDAMHRAWPDGAVALRSLLSGLWKTKGARPLLSVGKLVQAYDQASAEKDLRDRSRHRHQPWRAEPYADNVRSFRALR